MSSFFDGLNRFLQGKPVFEDPNAPRDQEAEQQPAQEKPVGDIDKADHHSFPVIRIERIKSHINGDHLTVYGDVKNEWTEEIVLDKVRLLGATRELDDYLQGGEQHEFVLYDGSRPSSPVYEAQIDYKTKQAGDYFQAVFDVGFEYDGNDKTYSVDEMRLRLPIRDIYG
jgi:hypothetical protein